MHWIHQFQLFLFDLDGLLVNTEEIHFAAYRQMLAARGFELLWDFKRYCHTAHYHSDKIATEFYEIFPALYSQESSWEVLYNEKKKYMIDSLNRGAVQLMPGVFELLQALADADIKRCVVTHSPDELVLLIRRKHAILESIPNWITRHDYSQPKPDSECYLKAIKMHSRSEEHVIGFEDTPRGLNALMGTTAVPMLICDVDYPEIPQFIAQGVTHFPSFKTMLSDPRYK